MRQDDVRPARLDPPACRAALRSAFVHPDLPTHYRPPTPRQRSAAFALAVAVGRCDLFGVYPRPASLPRPVLLAAAMELADRLTALAADVSPWADPAGLIERRLHAWAAYVAIEPELGEALSPVLDAAEACDAALNRLGSALARAAANGRVRAWRASLVLPYRELPPWWLSVTPVG